MADDLIAIEKELYRTSGVAPGQVWQQLVVRRRVQESPGHRFFRAGLS